MGSDQSTCTLPPETKGEGRSKSWWQVQGIFILLNSLKPLRTFLVLMISPSDLAPKGNVCWW